MKRSVLIIVLIAITSVCKAQAGWNFEITPLYFSAAGTAKFNDTADRLLVRCTGAMIDTNMELYCELSNSRTGAPIRPGRNYYVPVSTLSLLVANSKNIPMINAALAPFGVVAIKEVEQ